MERKELHVTSVLKTECFRLHEEGPRGGDSNGGLANHLPLSSNEKKRENEDVAISVSADFQELPHALINF